MSQLLTKFVERGYLVSPDLLDSFTGNVEDFLSFVSQNFPNEHVISKKFFETFQQLKHTIPKLSVTKSFSLTNDPKDLNHWIGYFNKRYEILRRVLQSRPELDNIVSISRINNLVGQESFSIIGMISDLHETSKGNVMMSVEDPTGSTKVLLNKTSPDYSLFSSLVNDEVIGLNLNKSGNWLFVKKIVFPDIPLITPKSGPEDACAAFISDTHIGSNTFLNDDFQSFIDWIKGDKGSSKEQELAAKTKYLFYVGDVVDGVGVYPGQEAQLDIKDIYKQYERAYDFLKQIPSDIKVIICPGNHDALRLSEPQPPLFSDFTSKLNKLPNILMVSNPSYVNVGATNGFQGFDVLLYHGYSFDYFINNNALLRPTGYSRPDLVMEFLMKKRHLAPTHGATLIAPTKSEDFLIIDKVPDLFATGHIHQSSISHYKNMVLLNCSCFQGQSDFMKRVGTTPNPGKVPVFNFKNRSISVLNFSSGDYK